MPQPSHRPRARSADSGWAAGTARTAVYFETHATSVDNEAGLASGHYDAPLSRLGEAQARQLGERYRGAPLALVLASDLVRARRTAEIAFAGTDVPLRLDARLRECDYGDLTRASVAAVERERRARVRLPFPNGESYEQCCLRLKAVLDELEAACRGQTVLVVGHRATWYALEHLLGGAPLEAVVAAPWRWQPGWVYRL